MLKKLGSWRKEIEQVSSNLCYESTIKSGILNSNQCDLRHFTSPVENQSSLSSCVGNAIVGGLELLRIKEGLIHKDLSRLFIYYNARAQHCEELKDEGTYIRVAIGTLAKLGTCGEDLWPYDLNKVFVRPSWNALRNAYFHKITRYSKIFSTGQERINNIKHALLNQQPVVFGMMVDQSFVDNTNGNIQFNDSFINLGSHAMLIVGFNDLTKTFIIRNSWGYEWGDQGYCYLKYDYLTLCEADDFWVLEGI